MGWRTNTVTFRCICVARKRRSGFWGLESVSFCPQNLADQSRLLSTSYSCRAALPVKPYYGGAIHMLADLRRARSTGMVSSLIAIFAVAQGHTLWAQQGRWRRRVPFKGRSRSRNEVEVDILTSWIPTRPSDPVGRSATTLNLSGFESRVYWKRRWMMRMHAQLETTRTEKRLENVDTLNATCHTHQASLFFSYVYLMRALTSPIEQLNKLNLLITLS